MLKIISISLSLLLIDKVLGQISFPEHLEIDKKKSNLDGRKPFYSPGRCKSNEWLFPGDQSGDYVCDCQPGAVYHPDTDACYPVFRQGPCPREQILVLFPNKVIPECISNGCKVDGKVAVRNKCYDLHKSGPCPMPELSYVLAVNHDTLQLDCVRESVSLATRFGDESSDIETTTPEPQNVNPCARGTKRFQAFQCRIKQLLSNIDL